MRQRDIISSLVWMLLGALFTVGGLQQGLMRRGVPGPGFLPFLSGIALVLVSLFVLLPALARARETARRAFFPERESFRKVAIALAALFGFGIAMEYLGYLITTFLFMLVLGQIIERRGWGGVFALASGTAVISYLLFVVLLEVQLPKGVLGF